MSKTLLLDTGFWYALYDDRDSYHEEAQILADFLEFHNLMIPWPTLYETLNTRFVRKRDRGWLHSFSLYLNRSNTVMLADETYRQIALSSVLKNRVYGKYLSLVDEVIRLVLQDPNVRIDAMLTFNQSDFYDICAFRNIELISS